VWADTTQTGVTARAPISLRYNGNTDARGQPAPANDVATVVPTNRHHQLPDHIQPLWERNPRNQHLTTCHTNQLTLIGK